MGKEQDPGSGFTAKVYRIFHNPDHQIIASTVSNEITFAGECKQLDPQQLKEILDRNLKYLPDHIDPMMNPGYLSGGEKELLNLVTALDFDPDILLVDDGLSFLSDENKELYSKVYDEAQYVLQKNHFNNELSSRLLKQAARELLLSESSDWSFILRAGTTTELAKERIERHLFRFWKLVEMIKNYSKINLKFLEDIEEEDKVFPNINIDDWRK